MPYPDMITAFANKSLDAGLQIEPFGTSGAAKGVQVTWKNAGDVMPGYQASFYLYSSQFAANKPEVAKRFLIAVLKGQRDYEDAFFKKKDQEAIIPISCLVSKGMAEHVRGAR